MSNFSYYTPTHVYFGRGTQNQVGELVRAQGCKKVLIHYGGQSARRSGLLAQVEASLDAAGVAPCSARRRRAESAPVPRL